MHVWYTQVSALGLCTGYIGCMALVLGAEKGQTPEEREAVGMVTSFSLMAGLCTAHRRRQDWHAMMCHWQ